MRLRRCETNVSTRGESHSAHRSLSFGSVAALYDQYRPGVPDSLNDWLDLKRGQRILEIAAGTGLVTRTLEKRGATVIAVEPDTAMLHQLLLRSPKCPGIVARAECLPLPDEFADMVIIMSAWHWLDAGATFVECARVLRDNSPLVIGWNGADQSVPWVKDLFALRRSLEGPGVLRHDADGVDTTLARDFDDVEAQVIKWEWSRSRDQLIKLFLTYSGVITLESAQRSELLDEVSRRVSVVLNGASSVEVPMSTRLWRARRTSRRSSVL